MADATICQQLTCFLPVINETGCYLYLSCHMFRDKSDTLQFQLGQMQTKYLPIVGFPMMSEQIRK